MKCRVSQCPPQIKLYIRDFCLGGAAEYDIGKSPLVLYSFYCIILVRVCVLRAGILVCRLFLSFSHFSTFLSFLFSLLAPPPCVVAYLRFLAVGRTGFILLLDRRELGAELPGIVGVPK